MVNVALCRFQQSLGPFAMFVVEDTSKTGFYSHFFNHLFRKRLFGKYIGDEGHLFCLKYAKFNVDFETAEENLEKVFVFSENVI